jgi:hypothetical protein
MSVLIQANIRGYQGEPVTLLSLFKPDSGMLRIQKLVNLQGRAKEGIVMVSNILTESYDLAFEESNLESSISWLFEMKNTNEFHCAVPTADPTAAIELDVIDSKGRNYRLSPTIGNAQIAALATVFYARSVNPVNAALDMFDRIKRTESDATRMMRGEVISF